MCRVCFSYYSLVDMELDVDDMTGTQWVVARGSPVTFLDKKDSSSQYCIVRIVIFLSPSNIPPFMMFQESFQASGSCRDFC